MPEATGGGADSWSQIRRKLPPFSPKALAPQGGQQQWQGQWAACSLQQGLIPEATFWGRGKPEPSRGLQSTAALQLGLPECWELGRFPVNATESHTFQNEERGGDHIFKDKRCFHCKPQPGMAANTTWVRARAHTHTHTHTHSKHPTFCKCWCPWSYSEGGLGPSGAAELGPSAGKQATLSNN